MKRNLNDRVCLVVTFSLRSCYVAYDGHWNLMS